MARVLVIGQAPSASAGKRSAFEGSSSGRRLALLLGVQPAELLRVVDTENLIPEHPGKGAIGDRFPLAEARRNADRLDVVGYETLVLCGRGVARALGVGEAPFLSWTRVCGVPAFVLPHPSGVSRWWNDPENRRAAQLALREKLLPSRLLF